MGIKYETVSVDTYRNERCTLNLHSRSKMAERLLWRQNIFFSSVSKRKALRDNSKS